MAAVVPEDVAPHPTGEGYVSAADGTPLWYRSEGRGPAIVCCNGVGVTHFFWDPLSQALRDNYRVVQWDYRAHGRSSAGPSLEKHSIALYADDLRAMMDALHVKEAVLLGHSMGCQVIFEFYRRWPERVRGLIPTLGTYANALDTFFNSPRASRAVFHAVRSLVMAAPGAVSAVVRASAHSRVVWDAARLLGVVHPDLCPREGMRPYMEHMGKLDLRVFFILAGDLAEYDATDLLGKIHVPTLVIAGERDLFTPLRCSYEMKERIPGAEILVVKRGSHAALIEQPELINLRVEKFLNERVFTS
jgi:pimeloyl-ACP methyl ester carboxylesterase